MLASEENLLGLMAVNRELVAQAEAPDGSDRVVLDMDSTESPVHRAKMEILVNELSHFRGPLHFARYPEVEHRLEGEGRMTIPTIAFDEAGNTGQNLLDPAQPIFVLSSVCLEISEAQALCDLVGGPGRSAF